MARGSGYRQPSDWKRTRQRILARDQHRCYVPGCTERAISVDHIIGVARGGGHEDANLAAICATHKRIKDEADRIYGIRLRAARRGRRRAREPHPNISRGA